MCSVATGGDGRDRHGPEPVYQARRVPHAQQAEDQRGRREGARLALAQPRASGALCPPPPTLYS